MARVFLDSNVFVKGICAEWSAAKAILILGRFRVLEIETSQVVLTEVTGALQRKGMSVGPRGDYSKLLKKLRLVVHPIPPAADIREGMNRYLPLMRHKTDVAVLVSALLAKPDWLVSDNPDHFTPAVASASGLRIVSPSQLMRYLGISAVKQSSA